VLTGWFAEFTGLDSRATSADVRYGEGAARFAGATYDPTSHYRAAAVQDFHVRVGLTPELAHEVNRHQVQRLLRIIEAIDADPSIARVEPMPQERRGGFVAIRAPRAAEIVRQLRLRGVHADARGDVLRLGPAPYLSDRQIRDAAAIYGEVVRSGRPIGDPSSGAG
jgi:kynureninase